MQVKEHTATSRIVLAAILAPLAISLLVASLGSLKVLVQVYQMSFIVGLLTTITFLPVSFLFGGSWLAYIVITMLWVRDYTQNAWEYWGKTILITTLALVGTWILYVFCAWVFIAVTTWLAN